MYITKIIIKICYECNNGIFNLINMNFIMKMYQDRKYKKFILTARYRLYKIILDLTSYLTSVIHN